jgi:L-threonylcarbamoyladenylate synthase
LFCSLQPRHSDIIAGLRRWSWGREKNLFEVARNLYKLLRQIDELDVDMAVTEGFEEKGLGLTIMNRLRKASGFTIIKTA